MLDALWRSPEHECVPGVPGAAGNAAGAEQEGSGDGGAGGAGAALHRARTLAVCAEELFLSRPAEGLPDFDVRAAAGDGWLARTRRGRVAEARGDYAAALGGRRSEGTTRTATWCGPAETGRAGVDVRGLQPRRHAADRDCVRAGHPHAGGSVRIPDDAQASNAVHGDERLQHGGGLAALRRERERAATGKRAIRDEGGGEEPEFVPLPATRAGI